MSDISEGIGAAIEGTLTGRAVEPEHGEAGALEGAAPPCSNCGAQPVGPFCQNCGQKTHIHRSLAAIAHDLMHGVLHLDGKLWATLPLLAFKPGSLTRRYIEGERAKFVSPMAMFLFSVFLMFAVFQMVGFTTSADINDGEFSIGLDTVQADLSEEIEQLEAAVEAAPPDSEERARLQEQLAGVKTGLESATAGARMTDAMANDPDFKLTGWDWLDEGLLRKWQSNPSLMLYKMQTNAYKFSWLLIPLSVPFVWLLFAWKRRFKAYDHAIFVTYSLSFMTLLFITLSILGVLGLSGGIIALCATLIPAVHIHAQLRGAYELGHLSVLWRFVALFVIINIVIVMFLQSLLLLGAF